MFPLQRRLRNVSLPSDHAHKRHGKISETAPDFCIDAGSFGNVARFINHSCEPNLFVQCVLSSHHDVKLARIVLFAADNIPALQVIFSQLFLLLSMSPPNTLVTSKFNLCPVGIRTVSMSIYGSCYHFAHCNFFYFLFLVL